MVEPEILINKLNLYGVRGAALNWIQSFLVGRKQVIQITSSNKTKITSKIKTLEYGIGQGTKMGPILFLLYINDMPMSMLTQFCLPIVYADDSNFKITAKNNEILKTNVIQTIIKSKSWLDKNGLKLNVNKTEILQFQTAWNKNPKINNIESQDSVLNLNNIAKFLGVYIDDQLRFVDHVNYVCKKLSSVIFALSELRHESDLNCLLTLYYANFHCNLKYGIVCWGNSIDSHRAFLLQKRAIRSMLFKKRTDSCKLLFKSLGVLPFPCIYIYECALYVKNHEHRFREHDTNHNHNTRHRKVNLATKYSRLEGYRNGPFQSCLRIYNKLPLEIKNIVFAKHFAVEVKKFLLKSCYYSVKEFLK
jgi:hypothetical protein